MVIIIQREELDSRNYIFIFIILWKSGIIIIILLLCEGYFYFHKIFQETQEDLCIVYLYTTSI